MSVEESEAASASGPKVSKKRREAKDGTTKDVPPPAARPFVKWAGGKTKLLPALVERLPESFVAYHEPFVGGGALFWHLAELRKLRKGRVALADTCTTLVKTWRVIRDDVDALVKRLARYPAPTEERFYELRGIDPNTIADVTDAAAWLIYTNKTCYNGLYRVNSSGVFNAPWGRWEQYGRTPTVLDEPNLRACSEVLRRLRVAINQRTFEDVVHYAQPGDLVYMDPPYLPKSETADFTGYTADGFGLEEHKRLRDVARQLKENGVHILLSNSDVPHVRELYETWSGFQVDVVTASRSVNSDPAKRGGVREIVVR